LGGQGGGGAIEKVIEVNAFGRLDLFFITGEKTNGTIKKQMHMRRFGFWL